MSLDVLAQNLASKGRNGDSMLVHMTPGEVHGLHALALAHGGQLTINPETGLPEANFLKKLLPMIAGFALGPAGFGIMSALGAAATVGGVTALATGSLQKGLMAGLGAYGGAGLGEGLSALGTQEAASKLAEQGIAAGAQENARDALLARAAEQTAIPTGFEAAKAGLSVAAKDPSSLISALGGGKQALQYAGMAAAPIMADQGVQTTTQMPTTPSYIRPFVYDAASFGQGPQGLQALAPVDASTINYGPPPAGANGGLVALARGGRTGDIPAPDDPNRKEFEQYLASQVSPQAYSELSASPYSAASAGFGESVAAHRQGLRSLQEQGITSVFGKEAQGYVHSPEQAQQWLQALSTENPLGVVLRDDSDYDLNALMNRYIKASTEGDAREAFRTAGRMDTLGLSGREVNYLADILAPDAVRRIGTGGGFRSMFSPGSSGWNIVGSVKPAGMTDEDIAYAMGLTTKEVKDRLATATQWERDPETGGVREKVRTGPAPEAPPVSKTPATDYLTGRTPDVGTGPPGTTPRGDGTTDYRTPTGTITGGTVTGGSVDTFRTTTTPPFELPPDQRTYVTPTAGVTPGSVTGGNVVTSTTGTTPAFTLPTDQRTYVTPTGTVTGGTVTGGNVVTSTTGTTPAFTLPTDQRTYVTPTGTVTGGTVTGGGVVTNTTGTTPTFTLPTDQQTRTVPEATVTPGTVTGGGVTTYATPTTPTFELSPEEQIFKTPVGTITGGTTTGMVDTKAALADYEKTAPTGAPPSVTSAGTLAGYKGSDKTYGGVEKPYAFPVQPALGTAGAASRGTETMADVRKGVGNIYDAKPSTFTPSVSGASESAYDYLMGKGAYPTDQFSVPDVGPPKPLWRPYVQAATGATAPSAFVPATGTPAPQFGFEPVTGGTTPTSGTQRWKNSKTGEIYVAPAGYAPPNADWVLDTRTTTNLTDATGIDNAGAGGPGGKAGGLMHLAMGGYAQGGQYNLGSYSDGGRLLRGPGDGVSDSIPATIGRGQPARLADGEFVVPARIVSELGNGSTEAGARKLYAMMDRVQRARGKTTGKNRVAANTKAERFLPA